MNEDVKKIHQYSGENLQDLSMASDKYIANLIISVAEHIAIGIRVTRNEDGKRIYLSPPYHLLPIMATAAVKVWFEYLERKKD